MPNLNIRVKEGYLEEIDKAAAKYNMNRTEFVIKAVDMLANFDEVFFKKIQQYSNELHIPEWLVLQNMIIKRMAEEAAKFEVWGEYNIVLMEFASKNDKAGPRTMTGSELFEMLKEQYVREEEKEKIRVLLNKEHYGIPISDENKAFLIKHKIGKAWLESEEYKREQKIKAEIDRFMKENNIQEGLEE